MAIDLGQLLPWNQRLQRRAAKLRDITFSRHGPPTFELSAPLRGLRHCRTANTWPSAATIGGPRVVHTSLDIVHICIARGYVGPMPKAEAGTQGAPLARRNGGIERAA